jgi:ABC-type transport system substrate-binding protein
VPVIRAQDNKDLQEFLHAARETVDQSQRLALYREADKLLIEEALVIPLAYTLGHYFVSSRVRKLPKTLLWQDIVLDLD